MTFAKHPGPPANLVLLVHVWEVDLTPGVWANYRTFHVPIHYFQLQPDYAILVTRILPKLQFYLNQTEFWNKDKNVDKLGSQGQVSQRFKVHYKEHYVIVMQSIISFIWSLPSLWHKVRL